MSSPRAELLQHVHGGSDRYRPWRVVVISLLCQQTTGTQVRKVVDELFGRWPVPSSMALAGPELETVLRPCGFQNRRAEKIRAVSHEYDDWLENELEPGLEGELGPPPVLVATWPGCGEYTVQAYRMIVRDDFSFVPKDKELLRLWKHQQQTEEQTSPE